jgi:hypothetical protein
MIRTFSVKNFRCFKDLRLDSLERVNLIAGKNNTGKTSLLEAIHLHNYFENNRFLIHSPDARGFESPGKAAEEVFSWLFFDRKREGGIELSSQNKEGSTRTMTIELVDAAIARTQRYEEAEQILQSSFVREVWDNNLPRLIGKYSGPDGERVFVAVLGGQSVSSPVNGKVTWEVPSIFIGSRWRNGPRGIQSFNDLAAANRQDDLLPSLQILEPKLKRLSLLMFAGEPSIHADVGLSRLIPVPFMGEGVARLLSILLAIAQAAGGIVLIDEIENGLHYSVMKNVWKAIAEAARTAEAQIFATTHSWECIQAAHHAYKESGPYEMRYYRLDRIKDNIDVKSMDEQMLTRIERTDLEVR